MIRIRKTAVILITFCIFVFISCTTRIDGSLAADGSATVTVNVALKVRMAALIQRMFAAGGQDGPVLDGPAIAQSMSGAPGITSVVMRNTSPAAIDGQVRIFQIGDFLGAANSGSANSDTANNRGFITFEPGRLGININRENGPVVLELLSSQITDYLSALMAPIATGEELTKSEYLELVASFYNTPISNEIESSRINATVDFPGNITGVTGGTFAGRRAIFDIPLLDLLVLETPMVFEVIWN
jgi:hypothetical protein